MSPWLTVALAGGLLVAVTGYVVAHLLPGRYRPSEASSLAGLADGVYLVLKPG